MSATGRKAAAGALPVADALAQSAALAGLMQRLQTSRRCLVVVHKALPSAWRDQVRAGTLDASGFTLLVPTGAMAAKLRQCLPDIEAALRAAGEAPAAIRVRVRAPQR